jgi:hypothetical protein
MKLEPDRNAVACQCLSIYNINVTPEYVLYIQGGAVNRGLFFAGLPP